MIKTNTPDVDARPIGKRTHPAEDIPQAQHCAPSISTSATDAELTPDSEHPARETADTHALAAEVCDDFAATCADYAARLEAESRDREAAAQAEALRRSFGTRRPAPLRPAKQDHLFDPIPQGRLF